jgi:hypothetical protein
MQRVDYNRLIAQDNVTLASAKELGMKNMVFKDEANDSVRLLLDNNGTPLTEQNRKDIPAVAYCAS